MAHHFMTVLDIVRDMIARRLITGTTHLHMRVTCEWARVSDSNPVFYKRIKLRCVSNTEQLLCSHKQMLLPMRDQLLFLQHSRKWPKKTNHLRKIILFETPEMQVQ